MAFLPLVSSCRGIGLRAQQSERDSAFADCCRPNAAFLLKDETTRTNKVGFFSRNLTTLISRNVDRTHTVGVGSQLQYSWKTRKLVPSCKHFFNWKQLRQQRYAPFHRPNPRTRMNGVAHGLALIPQLFQAALFHTLLCFKSFQ